MQRNADAPGQEPSMHPAFAINPRSATTVNLAPRWVQYSGVTVAARTAAELLADIADQAQGDQLPTLDREFVAYHLGLSRADKVTQVLAELEAIGFLTIHGGDVNPLTGKRRKLRDRQGRMAPDRFSVALCPPAKHTGPRNLREAQAEFACDRKAAYEAAKDAGRKTCVGAFAIRRGVGTAKPPCTYLYVIGSSDTGRVKIGVTEDPTRRLRDLQGSSPALLRLLWCAYGSRAIEERLHLRFHSYRTHGEWFEFGKRADPVAAVRAEALRLGAIEVAR